VIGWRWSWLQLRLEALEEQIEEHDRMLAQIKVHPLVFLPVVVDCSRVC
jgi:hypothetical protein